MKESLAASAGVYIHIPFCIRKCSYCDFLSGPATEEVREAYVHALSKELRNLCQTMTLKGESIRTIYFGGGTPSVLCGEQIRHLLGILKSSGLFVKEEIEITLEMNPGTADAQKLSQFRQAGINRLSMGMQSFHDEELKLLGRIHSVKEGIAAYHMAREAGYENISVDLMTGLPGQSLESCRQSLQALLALEPEHISCYSLILEEGTPFYDRYENYWTEETEELDRLMYELTGDLLKQAGYERYEISNYSKPGFRSQHNSSYWQGIPYYGCGLGASSLIYEQGSWYRTENLTELQSYLNYYQEAQTIADRHPMLETFSKQSGLDQYHTIELLSDEARMEEFMFLGLRMTEGVSRSDFLARFGKDINQVYDHAIVYLEKEGLLQVNGDRIHLSSRGLDLSNYCFEQFILD